MFCPNCGKTVSNSTKLCPSCKFNLSKRRAKAKKAIEVKKKTKREQAVKEEMEKMEEEAKKETSFQETINKDEKKEETKKIDRDTAGGCGCIIVLIVVFICLYTAHCQKDTTKKEKIIPPSPQQDSQVEELSILSEEEIGIINFIKKNSEVYEKLESKKENEVFYIKPHSYVGELINLSAYAYVTNDFGKVNMVELNLPKVSILNEDICDDSIKAQVEIRVVLVPGKITKNKIRGSLIMLYNRIKERKGFRYHKHPTHVGIYMYTSKEEFEQSGANWIAMLNSIDNSKLTISFNKLKIENLISEKNTKEPSRNSKIKYKLKNLKKNSSMIDLKSKQRSLLPKEKINSSDIENEEFRRAVLREIALAESKADKELWKRSNQGLLFEGREDEYWNEVEKLAKRYFCKIRKKYKLTQRQFDEIYNDKALMKEFIKDPKYNK
ncbi:MAG: zinc ribbon domain-containing protein [bacterium]|nr:zinc ribbon domain-containing protein [bacterium]